MWTIAIVIVDKKVWNEKLKYCFRYIWFPLFVRFLVNLLIDVHVPKLIKMYFAVNKSYLSALCHWLLLVCTVPWMRCDWPSFEFALNLYPVLTNQYLSFLLPTNYCPLKHPTNTYVPCQSRLKTDNISLKSYINNFPDSELWDMNWQKTFQWFVKAVTTRVN
jgi:hypothetical protein